MTDKTTRTEADAIAAIAAQGARSPMQISITPPSGMHGLPSSIPALLTPAGEGWDIEPVRDMLENFRTAPEDRKGTARFTELPSLIEHANRFKDGNSALFAIDNPTQPKLVSVLDYHGAGTPGANTQRWGRHRGEYAFPLSDEWQAWTAAAKEPLDQWKMANFLEDRIIDVIDVPLFLADYTQVKGELTDAEKRLRDMAIKIGGKPCGPGKLMELSKGIQIAESSNAKTIINTNTGEARLVFETEHKDAQGKPLDIPNMFLIAIPVFTNGPAYRIAVRLQFRKVGGSISWMIKPYRTDLVWRDAFLEGCAHAQARTELPLFFGTPE